MSLKGEILDLLRRDEEFRYAVAGLIGLEEILRRLDRHEEILAKHGEELIRLREDMNRLREDMNRLREDMNRGFALLERHITALGARWGLMSEEAFREGLRGLLEREFGAKVERWAGYDGEGLVYGYPSRVEIDVAICDGRAILVEVKAHASASDVYALKRKAELYERLEGERPSRLVLVAPYVDADGLRAAERMGIEVYTKF